ncbi:MAG: ATP-dependent Clp protease ATP-binding subunit [Rikenellaceae bacterium]|nr:ATP-dependent Clp protease ATP-binding subunit [Rikenellaceae bacterium]MCL2693221.1 ATP-dependent Clp protease ATP-binding subunit [Rikenellaceae bacterium]
MQIRQSATLQRHLRTGSREAQRAGIFPLMHEIAFVSMLGDGNSHARQILGAFLKDWEVYQMGVRIERECSKAANEHKDVPATDPRKIVSEIIEGIENARLAAGGAEGGVSNTGHFLLWLLTQRDSVCAQTLELYDVTLEKVVEQLTNLPDSEDIYIDVEAIEKFVNDKLVQHRKQQQQHVADESAGDEGDEEDYSSGGAATKTKTRKGSKSMIEQFAVNLTQRARNGEIDPVVGRTREIERLVQILGRRKKNNPVLIGEPGVGKSAIVEGLALRMASRETPYALRGKEIYSLDVTSLVAGTKYRGEFEERIKKLLDELTANRNVILFIDEIHTIVGAGSTQGSLDTANILKPALARGELQCIGATTLDEYRENIEKDGALERRFQKILVEPATRDETLHILENIKGSYERHHGVQYTQAALRACVDLSDRYITDRHLPDKAIDALDEAGAKARLAAMPEPKSLRDLERDIQAALAERQAAVAASDFDAASRLRLRVLSLRAKLEEAREDWRAEVEANRPVIGVEHIEEIIASMTGIPVERASQDEKARLGAMNDHLSGRVIGQDTAVEKVVKSIQRSRAGLKDPNKPIGVFMFVGPTGVGKTHLAKELSRWMFDRPDALIRIDMSEYSEKHNVSRMIGSPPGYVGYNEGGQLTEAVRRQPYAVVLFDEIEKAHPDVFNIMLQIFDDGQLTDGNGRKVDFRNTVIIMTSNVGSRTIARKAPVVGYNTSNKESIQVADTASNYRGALETAFAPEFINRIDDIVVFNTLRMEDVERIVDLELGGLFDRARKLGFKMRVSAKAKKHLAALGYEPRYGVRSLKRTILDNVEEPLATMIVSGEVGDGDTVTIGVRGEQIELVRKIPRARVLLPTG